MRTAHKVGAAGTAAAVIACCVTFTPTWEGLDLVAKRDPIGTGHPITYCNGLTSHDGAVKVGQRFTKASCDKLLAKALPTYLAEIRDCEKASLPLKTETALLDAAFNAGSAAVCRSPMLAKMNIGDIRGGCLALDGWYVTTKNNGKRALVPGLVHRRSGDYRKGEKQLCLEGIEDDRKLDRKVSSPVPAANPPVRRDSPRRWWRPFGG